MRRSWGYQLGWATAVVAISWVQVSVLAANGPDPLTVADAAKARDAATVRALLKNGADVNAAQGDGMTALHWAASNGDATLTQMLLAAAGWEPCARWTDEARQFSLVLAESRPPRSAP